MMDEKKEQLEKVRRAFRDPYLRGWIPNYLLTILEQGEDTEDKYHVRLPAEHDHKPYVQPLH